MSKKITDIIVVETSEIIYEGIYRILTNAGLPFNIHPADNLCDLEQLNIRTKEGIIIINPVLIQNQLKYFQSLKKELYDIRWIGIVYSFIDPRILTALDAIVNINDSRNDLIASIQRLMNTDHKSDNQKQQQETLSERETDVLKLLVAGNANKEIADKLYISIHTVISHRKNISQKTGIKSVSGLTIYAVVNNIISIDSYRE
jgi:DNA-binding NarL/FixJ family response regulator